MPATLTVQDLRRVVQTIVNAIDYINLEEAGSELMITDLARANDTMNDLVVQCVVSKDEV